MFAVSVIHTEVLRLECKRFANFSISKHNVALHGSLITTLLFKSNDECSSACMMNFHCKSYNKENEGKKRCELNHKTTEDREDNARLGKRPGWTFVSTDYDHPLVRHFLFSSKLFRAQRRSQHSENRALYRSFYQSCCKCCHLQIWRYDSLVL